MKHRYFNILALGILFLSTLLVQENAYSFAGKGDGYFKKIEDSYKNRKVEKIFKLFKEKDFSEAVDKTQKLLKKEPGNDFYWFLNGMAYFMQKNAYSAGIAFTQAIRVNPGRGDAFYYRGSLNFNTKHYEKALADLNKALEVKSTPSQLSLFYRAIGQINSEMDNLSDIYWMRSRVLFSLNQYEPSLKDINKSIELATREFLVAFLHRGYVHYHLGHLEQSYSDFQKVLQTQPDHVQSLNMLGVIRFIQGNYEEALGYYEKAGKFNPKDASIILNSALAYLLSGQDDKAIAMLEKISKSSENPVLHFHLGYAYSKRGDKWLAESHIKKAFALNTDIIDNRKALLEKVPADSQTREFYQKEIQLAEHVIYGKEIKREVESVVVTDEQTGSIDSGDFQAVQSVEKATLDFISISVVPQPVSVNKKFDINICFKRESGEDEEQIEAVFSFSISQNGKVLFNSPESTIKGKNREEICWTAHMDPVPVKGQFIVSGMLKCRGLEQSKKLMFAIQ